MQATASPITLLSRLAASRATGELIAAGDGLEVHLYLQAGRVAWGTTTEERFVFRRHLVERCQVDEQALRAVFEECQRDRQPLGERLIARGLLSLEQVREALGAQVSATLASLARCSGAQTLFLPRGQNYATYDQRLTFELDERCGVRT